MENVDVDRMKRVLDRLYSAGRPSAPDGKRPEEPEDLENVETRLQSALRNASKNCQECRRTLSPVLRRSEKRTVFLRTDRFVSDRPGIQGRPRPEQGGGTLSSLRTAVRLLETLSERYARVPARPGRGDMARYAEECRRDADAVRSLLAKLMR